MTRFKAVSAFLVVCLFILVGSGSALADRTLVDTMGRSVTLPDHVERFICSGPGALRLATYLEAGDRVVGVDDIEGRQQKFDARPYALARPQYRSLPVFGGFRGHDDPEKILGLDPQPQVIFKTFATMGHDPVELANKTGIPVVVLDYGNLGPGRDKLFASIALMGEALGVQDRAQAVIDFFKGEIEHLKSMSAGAAHKKTCYIGGVAFKGPHGFTSTEPIYPPFALAGGINIAGTDKTAAGTNQYSVFSKEKILTVDPDVLFLDLSTLQMGEGHGGLVELRTDPVFQALTAVQTGQVFGVLPYNWYTQNFGSILADAWFVGKTLYPERFKSVDPAVEAGRIYQFLLGADVFDPMNRQFGQMAFVRLDVKK